METKSLLYGLIGFFAGGLLVSVAASMPASPTTNEADMTMSSMTRSLETKRGDDFDRAFIEQMIAHHEGAVEMAELSASRAQHDEIKKMSNDVIRTQQSEIDMMRQWQRDWGYVAEDAEHNAH